jgi:hypothetical protein
MRLLSKTLAVLSIAWLASSSAQAQECKEIDTLISTSYFLSGCTSPYGLCTAGTVAGGPLAGTTRFVVLTLGPGASPADLVYTGELVITTKHGSVTVHDSGVFNQVTGKYFELQQIISGTKKFEHATGALTSSGIGTTTGFSGRLTGEVCRGEEHAEEAEGRTPKAE